MNHRKEPIGKRIRRLREEAGLSQRQLSSPGVSYAYISRIEAGARHPSVKALRLIARKLKTTPIYLEFGDHPPQRCPDCSSPLTKVGKAADTVAPS